MVEHVGYNSNCDLDKGCDVELELSRERMADLTWNCSEMGLSEVVGCFWVAFGIQNHLELSHVDLVYLEGLICADLRNSGFGNFGCSSDSGFVEFVSENFDSCFASDLVCFVVNCLVNYLVNYCTVNFYSVALDTASHHHKYWNQPTL